MSKYQHLAVTVTTVERCVLNLDQVKQVIIPTKSGVITVLPNHAPLTVVLDVGELAITGNAEVFHLFIGGGVGQITGEKVEILAHQAERTENLDAAKIEEAKRRAEQLLSEKPVDVDLARVEASLRREVAKLKLIQKNKTQL
ncbi:ATP synthase F1 subunit epsilon [candidate division WWE3 bacterium]|nr:ATP synthase F1 subunit epsilon [candidate division WWE3 bacterium]